jgi:hypothetical protein
MALALDCHGEHEGERVLACPGGTGEDERVGKAAGTDGGAEALDGGSVAEEVVEAGGERGCGVHGSLLLTSSIYRSRSIDIERGRTVKESLLQCWEFGRSHFNFRKEV